MAEFGLGAGDRPTLAAFNVYIADIKALGFPMAKGLTSGAGLYWDANDWTRAFARFHAERKALLTKTHAAAHTTCLHFLRSMQAAGTQDALAVNGQCVRCRSTGSASRQQSGPSPVQAFTSQTSPWLQQLLRIRHRQVRPGGPGRQAVNPALVRDPGPCGGRRCWRSVSAVAAAPRAGPW